jgi:ABC-type glycerol-3-phosphate transport system substrate-binding protein
MFSANRSNLAKIAILSTAIALGLSACGSSTPKAASGSDSGKKYTIAMITHETPGDT